MLTDIPNFDFSGKTPWELGMSYSTWKRQLCTVAGTASGKFQPFVEACVAEAEMRYQCKAQDREMPALGSYSRYPSGYAGRLVVQLLRVLPESPPRADLRGVKWPGATRRLLRANELDQVHTLS